MNIDKKTQEFCKKYEARIRQGPNFHRRVPLISPSWTAQDTPITYDTITYENIPLAEIHMPMDRLTALIDLEDYKDRLQRNLMSPIHSSGIAYHMLKEYEEECRIRHTNPAVKKAYEHYQMLLNLSR